MKPSQKIKPAQVKLLNVALSAVQKMGVEISRDELKGRFGVASTKDLTCAQFDEAMQLFEGYGFRYRPSVKNAPKVRAAARTKQVFLAAVEKLLNDLGKDWAYAEGIARQMGYAGQLQWLRVEQLHKVQIALIYEWRKAQGQPVKRRRAAP